MAKIRVYELARDLNTTNKALLDKIKDMDIDVKSHMSSLDDDIVALIKSNILGKKEKAIDEKRVKPTVIRRRRKAAQKATPGEPEETETTEEKPAVVETPAPEPEAQISAKKSEAPADAEPEKTGEQPGQEPEEKPEEKPEAVPEVPVKEKPAAKPKKSPPAKIISAPTKVEPEPEKEPETPEEPVVKEQPESAEEPQVEEKPDSSPSTVAAEETPQAEIPSEPVQPDKKEAPESKPEKPVKKKGKKQKKQTAAKIIKLPTAVPLEEIQATAEEKSNGTETGDLPAEGKTETVAETDKVSKKHRKKKPAADEDQDTKFLKKKISFRKKAVVEGKALYDDAAFKRGRKPRKGAKIKQPVGQKTQITTPKAIKRRIKIDDTIVLSDLSKRMGIKASEMIQKLMNLGVMATVNQTIDFDTAVLVAAEFEYELEKASFEENLIIDKVEDDPDKLTARPPVVTIMGHVDHGKTSLLDVIRKSSITHNEAGGITQHIGAYNVETDKGQIVFLDTPGHEAFTAMRSRGAQVTDIVVLVVAADDGVMPQTIEAINHSKAADVPIIVAINKIDKPDAEPERVKRELSEQGIVSEDWGGDVIFVNVSAKQNIGIEDLLDMILLQAEVMEFKANYEKLARGHVIEAKLDSGRGPVATVLIQEGTLRTGEAVVCGIHYGKIRAMLNDMGQHVDEAGPSIPVEILGLTGVPTAGDELITIDDEKNAKQVSMHRIQKQRSKELAKSSRLSLEKLFEKMEEGELKELNLIIKADVQGSIEALKDSLVKLSTNEVKINVVHSATGTITESDVSLAAVSNAIIIGFNVRPGAKVHELAAEEHVDMRFYDIIYNAIKDIKGAMVGMMDSTFQERILGRAEIREVFVIPKKGSIAGSYVTDGKIERGQHVRLLRDGVIVYDGKISSLRRFKDDVKDVQVGYECGIGIENFNDLKVSDVIECYYLEEIKPTLE